jgi:N-acetylglucosamine-6-sulfatase
VEQGVTFSDFHTETPQCCPGRAGFLTGLHTPNHGVIENDARLFRPRMTLATQLRAAGYHTFLAGKYLNEYDRIAPAIPPGWDEFHVFTEGYYNYPMWNGGRVTRYHHRSTDYSTDVIARKAVAAIRRAPGSRPIFGWIAPFASHKPYTPPVRHRHDPGCEAIPAWSPPGYMEADVTDKPEYVRRMAVQSVGGFDLRNVCRTLLAADDLVRNIRAELARQGRLDNTLLILAGDNGMTFGAHRLLSDKKSPYATQLPFFVSWPGVLGTTPRSIGTRVQNIDFAPTVCELVGCVLGPYPSGQAQPDGISFAGLLQGRANTLDRDAVYENYLAPGHYIPRWQGLVTTDRSALADQGCFFAAFGGCRWMYTVYSTGERELYDLSNGPCWSWLPGEPGDPCMLDNLAGQPAHAGLERELVSRLEDLRHEGTHALCRIYCHRPGRGHVTPRLH